MPSRRHQDHRGAPPKNNIRGSVFDSESRVRPSIPRGLPPSLRKDVETILDQNRFLQDPQVPAVIRLCRLRERFDAIGALLDEQGYQVESKDGTPRPNPLIAEWVKIQSAIVTQERQLAIAIVSRSNNITKEEQRQNAISETKLERGSGTPPLRLA